MIKKYPLSETQLGLYYDWLRHPELTELNIPYQYKFSTKIDADRLEKAVQSVLSNHPIYFTRIISQDGNVYQYPDLDRPIPVVREFMEEDKIEEWGRNFVRPFDLHKDPLVRPAIVETNESVYFFFDTQHIIHDGATLTLFLSELEDAYQQKELYPEKDTFFDYANTEKDSFKTEQYKEARAYFRDKFEGLSMTKVGTQHSDKVGLWPAISRFMSAQEVDDFCKEYGVASNLLFMAGFSYALSVFSREQQVVYYTVNHGRIDRRFRKSFGPFIKSVPIQVNLANDLTAIDLMQALKRELMGTIRHGVYPFSHFCQDLSITPECSFTFQATHNETATIGGEFIHTQALPSKGVNANMDAQLFCLNGRYEIRLEYNDSRHYAFEMNQFIDCMYHCVRMMMEKPEVPFSEFTWMPSDQRYEMLQLSAGEKRTWGNATFLDLFQQQVQQTPERIAVVDDSSQLTYQELSRASDIIAAHLLEKGIKRNEFVGIQMPRNKEWLIAILGIFKAGGAYLPLASDNPVARLEYIKNDSGVKVVLTEADFTSLNGKLDFKPVSVSPDDYAYMIYTSGSTGQPKGVVISHRALVAFIQNCRELYQLDEHDRIFCHSSFSFDASVEDIFAVLTCGGSLHVMPDYLLKEPALVAEYIQSHHVTGGNFTTRLGVEMLKHYDLPLKYLTLGGERLEVVPETEFRLFNSYGPTEFTVDATFQELKRSGSRPTIPIGRPTFNSHAYVLDQHLQLVPKGCVGELFLAGPQIASGYWNQESLTKTKFIQNPFNDTSLMYRTGDLVWWNEEGVLEFVGRVDNQVKISGYRIETGEIENTLLQCDGVDEVVVAIKEIGDMKRICAYYKALHCIDEKQLRDKLQETLPFYMIPWRFIFMESFPLLPSGKVNMKKLPLPASSEYNMLVAPNTLEEQMIEQIFSRILKVDRVGVETDVFSLGLTSLQAMQASFEAEALGLRLPVSTIYAENTIRKSLKSSQNYYYWLTPDDSTKPVMVLVCGYVYLHPFYDKFVDFFKDKFSIFVLDCILGNTFLKDYSFAKLMDFYLDVIRLSLGNRKISLVTGFCLGSELAIHLASRLKREKIAEPKVLIMDGYMHREVEIQDQSVRYDPVTTKHNKMLADLVKTLPKIDYEGEIMITMSKLFSKKLEVEGGEESDMDLVEKAHQQFIENVKCWRKTYPNSPYLDVEATHWTFFDPDPLAQVWEQMKKYWKYE